jgi:hypothetical protein
MQRAFKEWAIALSALAAGKTIVLLRKGGIREAKGSVTKQGFQVLHQQVLLYPTYEHQRPELLKSPYSDQVQPVCSGWHPDTVEISLLAEITDTFAVSEAAIVEALLPYHIWQPQFVTDRLHWKPHQPIVVLCIRAYQLAHPEVISFDAGYGGCRSWLELKQDIATTGATPVLSDDAYSHHRADIRAICQGASIQSI